MINFNAKYKEPKTRSAYFWLQNSPQHSEETGRPDTIIRALDQFETNTGLVADGSRDYSLPTIPGKHSDLKTISCDTVSCSCSLLLQDILYVNRS